MKFRIWGARGSLPTPLTAAEVENKIIAAICSMPDLDHRNEEAVRAYVRSLPRLLRGTAGGNTTCVEVTDGTETIIIDAGTGIRELGNRLMNGPCGRGAGRLHLILTHLHWDHVQGFPFFRPAYVPGNEIIIYSAHDARGGLQEQQQFTFFPVPLDYLQATFRFVPIEPGQPFTIGNLHINTIENAHPNRAYSLRFEDRHSVLVHASDAEYPHLDADSMQPYIDFFRKADALIFDAQYTLREAWQKPDWGHSSALIGVDIARAAGAKRLILFHHDPSYDDQELRAILRSAQAYQEQDASGPRCQVLMGYEGMAVDLTPADSMEMRLSQDGETAIVSPGVVFNPAGVEQLEQQLSEWRSGPGRLGSVIDLSRVDHLTLSGLRALIRLRERRPSDPLVLVAPSERVRQTIEIAGWEDYFAIYPDVETALNAMRARERLALPGHTLSDRYQIRTQLQEMRKSVLLEALDKQVGETVLLRLFEPEISARQLDRIAQTRGQLVGFEHAHLVTVLGWERDGDHAFLVERWPGRKTLADRILAGETLPPEEAWELGRQLLEALVAAHSQGVTHGNLAPAHVFLNRGTLQVAAFGLGLLDEGRVLQEVPPLMISPAYAAPEQVLGQPADARTDLYALGVVLYELYTGRQPFAGDLPEIWRGHLHLRPRLPREINRSMTRTLEHVILKLLAKNPNNRYATARQVLDIWHSLQGPVDGALRPGRSMLVGRHQQVALLLTRWEEARAGTGQLAFVSGETGIGKTSLTREVAAQSEAQVVLEVQAREGERTNYQLFANLLRAYLATVPPELGDEDLRPLLANLAHLTPELLQLIPNLESPGWLEPEHERLRLMASVTRFVQEATARRPWLIVLDDLQWADDGSLELLRYLGRSLPQMPLMIIATFRTGELDAGHPLQELVRDLSSHPGASRVALERLDEQGVRRLLTSLWQTHVPLETAQRMHQHTGGNPLYVEEVAREIVEEDVQLEKQGRLRLGALDSRSLPATMQEAVWRRISLLNSNEQAVLHQAAVLGTSFQFDHLRELTEMDEQSLMNYLDAALERQIVVELGAEPVLAFRHPEIQRVLYDDLGPLRRRVLHRRAANLLERRAQPQPEHAAAELAYHFRLAGDTVRAMHYTLLAAERDRAAYANEKALEGYLQVLETLEKEPAVALDDLERKRFEVHVALGDLLATVGRYDEALEHCQTAWKRAPDSVEAEELAALCRQTAELYERRNAYDQARLWLHKGLTLLRDEEAVPERVRLLNAFAWVQMRQGLYAEANQTLARALRLARALEQLELEASTLRHVGIGMWYLEAYDEARAYWEEALARYQMLGDRYGEGTTFNNLGLVALDRGDYQRACEYFTLALQIVQETGNRWRSAQALNNLGDALKCLGCHRESEQRLDEAMALCEELGDRQSMSMVLDNLAYLYGQEGRHVEALERARRAVDLGREIEDRRRIASGLTGVAHALRGLGRAADAIPCYTEAIELRAALGQRLLALDAQTGLALALLDLGHRTTAVEQIEPVLAILLSERLDGSRDPLTLYLGAQRVLMSLDDPRAAEVLAVGREVMQQQAEAISDPELRRAFLDIPAHRELAGMPSQV